MQQYRKDAKKHMTNEEYSAYKARRSKKLCHGGKPHDYVLVLPSWGVKWDGHSAYDAEAYYKAQEEQREFIKKQNQVLAKKGIIVQERFWPITKHYMCSVCKKQRYGE